MIFIEEIINSELDNLKNQTFEIDINENLIKYPFLHAPTIIDFFINNNKITYEDISNLMCENSDFDTDEMINKYLSLKPSIDSAYQTFVNLGWESDKIIIAYYYNELVTKYGFRKNYRYIEIEHEYESICSWAEDPEPKLIDHPDQIYFEFEY